MKELIATFNKRTMNLITVLFFGLSFFFIYFAYHNTADPKDLVAESAIMSNIVDECEISANKLGFKNVKAYNRPVSRKKTVTIEEKTVSDHMDLIVKTTILKSECKKLTLVNYCLDKSCKSSLDNGNVEFKMILSLREEK